MKKRKFFKSWGICLLTSVGLALLWIFLEVDLMIYRSLTGFEEFALGEGLLMAVMSFSYMISCSVGCVIAGILSFYRQKKRAKQQCQTN